MLLKDFINSTVTSLCVQYPEKEARSIVFMLCADRLGTKNYTHIIEPEYEIAKDKEEILSEDAKRLIKGEPIQYVIGKAEFCDRIFKVNENVLIPRPETELLCHKAVQIAGQIKRVRSAYGKNAEAVKVLDLCTGSGNIAWTIALEVPGVEVIGLDISQESIDVAKNQNFDEEIKKRGAVKPKFITGDVLNLSEEVLEQLKDCDMILSNPPYILENEKLEMRRNVLDYEPDRALFVPDSDPLLFYKEIANLSKRLLRPEGVGLVEINEDTGQSTAELFKKNDFEEINLIKDFNNRNRFVYYK